MPDTTTRALELRKGSADIAINALTSDMVLTLEQRSRISPSCAPPARCWRIWRSICAIPFSKTSACGRRSLTPSIAALCSNICGAVSPGPPTAFCPRRAGRTTATCPPTTTIPSAPASCSSKPDIREVNGVRFHLTMKTSTEESTRLMAAVLQQQLRQVGIALDIRTFEFATFFSDVTHGLFQLYSLRWIGGNEDPDIFEYVFHSSKFPPNGANRGFFANPRVDALIDQARHELDQNTRKQLYAEIQRILADELPYINLWYFDNVLVHSKRVRNLTLNPSGNYDFLKTAELDESRQSSVVSRQ